MYHVPPRPAGQHLDPGDRPQGFSLLLEKHAEHLLSLVPQTDLLLPANELELPSGGFLRRGSRPDKHQQIAGLLPRGFLH
ncbi:MAG TPA: hypothetical protein PLC79_06555, partial [Phycisphaerae bacterium]|nr:hypothetical protein [Phycisphaerae bacterium]